MNKVLYALVMFLAWLATTLFIVGVVHGLVALARWLSGIIENDPYTLAWIFGGLASVGIVGMLRMFTSRS